MRHTLDNFTNTGDCFVVLIDTYLLPIISGTLRILEEERSWEVGEYETAYNRIIEVEASMALMCAQDLIESNNRLYRLLDWGLNGTIYSAGADPPSTITPSIPDVPSTSTSLPGLIHTLVRNVNLLDNSINGADNVDFSAHPSVKEQLQTIINNMSTEDTDIESIITQLEAIAVLLG